LTEPRPAAGQTWNGRFARYREDLLKAGLLGIPLAVLGSLNQQLSSRLFSQPWQAIWVLIPVAIGVVLLRPRVAPPGAAPPTGRALAFLGAYLLLFTVASQTSVLDISRELTAFDRPASRRTVTPVSWGDWRYSLVPRRSDPRDELMVVLLASGDGRTLADGRKELIDLIALASRFGATGVALDVYFSEPSPIDPLLCQTIAAAGIPVFVGFGFERRQGRILETTIPKTLEECLTPQRLAHLAGFLDFDLVSRLTPMFFRNDPGRPALGLAVARTLAGESGPVDVPPDGLLRFVAPAEDPLTVRFDELRAGGTDPNFMRSRFVMAGEAEQDSFDTPFGSKPGIVIHAYVAHSLRQGHDIRRHAWWLGLAVTLVFCYAMTAWDASGASAARLFALCAAATVVILAIAVASIRLGPYWFDVIYPLLAVWLLPQILLGARRAARSRERLGQESVRLKPDATTGSGL
jgi:CHASE2 domain-containing sensor protein